MGQSLIAFIFMMCLRSATLGDPKVFINSPLFWHVSISIENFLFVNCLNQYGNILGVRYIEIQALSTPAKLHWAISHVHNEDRLN